MYLGLRVLTGALVASGLAFLIGGSHAYLLETRIMLIAWGLLLGAAGIAMTACLFLDTVIREEGDRNARVTAEAVGAALGQVLAENEPDVSRLPPTRRGT